MKWGRKITFGMLVLSMVFSTVILGRNLWVQEKEQMKFERLQEKVVEEREKYQMQYMEAAPGDLTESVNDERTVLPEYQELVRQNPDFAGWISIEGTYIDYPVMQTLWDMEYYLHRNFEKEDSYAGVPFVGSGDMKKEEGDLFLYGHNMRNGTMFADLLNYRNQDYYEVHPRVRLDTLWEYRTYEVFTAFYAKESDWNDSESLIFSLLNGERLNFVEKIGKAEIYDTGVILKMEAPLLILITCSYHDRDERFVVVSQRL